MTALIFSGPGISLAVIGLALLMKNNTEAGNAFMAIGNWLMFLSGVVAHTHVQAAINGLCAVLYTWLWWRGGGGRRTRKVARQLGDKSAARVRALVEQMTPSPIPSPAGSPA